MNKSFLQPFSRQLIFLFERNKKIHRSSLIRNNINNIEWYCITRNGFHSVSIPPSPHIGAPVFNGEYENKISCLFPLGWARFFIQLLGFSPYQPLVTLIRIGLPWVIIGDERERPYNKRGACLLKMRNREGFDDETTLRARLTSALFFFLFSFLFVWQVFPLPPPFLFVAVYPSNQWSTGKELKFGNILQSL